jgi:hypothetical protein
MAEALIVPLLLICTVAGLVLRDTLKRSRVSLGHIAVFVFASLASMVAPDFLWDAGSRCPRPRQNKNACINNLREIDGAKEQWALENHVESGKLAIVKEVDAYIKGGHPKCPQGGTYTYGKVDEPPRCSIKGHNL